MDFFKENWKIAAGCAAGAFLLSFLIGLISRNPFGVVILRALLLAILFAGLGVGARIVVLRYLPETIASGEPAPAAPEKGARIDITLPEEDGIDRQQAHAETRAGRVGGAAADDMTLRAEAEALGELGQGLGDDLGAADEDARVVPETARADRAGEGDNKSASGGGQSASGGGEFAEEGESVTILPSATGSEEDLDTLPNLSSLDTAADADSDGAGSRPVRRVKGGDTPENAVRSALSGQDPATLARAIRTVLSKDEKG